MARVRRGAPALPGVLSALDHADDSIRSAAVSVLGEMRAIEQLRAALTDPHHGVRQSLATALGGTGDARACELLAALAADEVPEVREKAAHALRVLGVP